MINEAFTIVENRIKNVVFDCDSEIRVDFVSTPLSDRLKIIFASIIPQVVFNEVFAITPFLVENGIRFYVSVDDSVELSLPVLTFYRRK